MDKRLKEKHDKRYKNEVFHKDNIVLVQLWTVRGRRRSPRKRFIIEGKIIDKNLKSNSYKISLTCPGETQQTILWVTIDDLTIAKKQEKAPKKQNRSYYISLAKTDRLENLTNQEFSVIYDPPRDGSCQFYALACAHLVILVMQVHFAVKSQIIWKTTAQTKDPNLMSYLQLSYEISI